jgi:hypothetical protein
VFVFVVPFKSKAVCANWEKVSSLCGRTVRSLLAPAGDVRVVLVCNEQPSGLPNDPRLIIHSVETPFPKTAHEMMVDKYRKIAEGLTVAREFAPCWLMMADADDLVSRRLVPFVERQDPKTAWYAEFGWVRRGGSRWVMRQEGFHRVCGTSSVRCVAKSDLPQSATEPREKFYLLTQGHNIVVDYHRESGIPTRPFPFASTIYETETGENWSGNSYQRSRRLLVKQWLASRLITSRMQAEFGL